MGCGCGGRKGGGRTPARVQSVTPASAGAVSGRQVQVQTNTRQALVQATQERMRQNPPAAQNNVVGARADMEKRKKIQVSLRNRNKRP